MNEAEKLRDLLHELERTHSPFQRLRLVALAWRTVRALPREERENLAMRVGLAEAGGLVEKLAARDGGVAPTELLEAIHAAETTDPARLRQLLGGVKEAVTDRDERRRLLDRAADALDEVAARAAPPATGPVTAGPAAKLKGPPTQPIPRPAPPEPTPPPPPPRPRPAQPPTMPLPPPHVLPTAPPPPQPAPPRPALPEPEPVGGAVDAFLVPLPGRRSLVARLGALHRNAPALGGASREELRQAVEAFPGGWARRRALCALLEQGVPAATDAALALVAALDGERDRAWCLATLLRTRRLSDRQLEIALQLVGSAAQRGRLRRLARTSIEAPVEA